MFVQAESVSLESAQASRASDWKKFCNLGGTSAWILLAYSLVTMLILVVVGGQPENAQEAFTMLQNGRLVGLLRLDVLSIIIMPLYYLLFLSLYIVLRKTDGAYALVACGLVFAGVTLFLATPSVFSWLALSDKFAAATDETYKAQLLAAGEAILASDMWHGSGALVGGLLLQSGALWLSLIMLRGNSFGKLIAYVGILTHGLDLAHILVGFFLPEAGIIMMVIAGPLYLVWFPLVARRLIQLGQVAEME